MNEREKRETAWVGDAVLSLFARQWLLSQNGISAEDRIEQFTHLTSNQFLACFGEPTAMEAEIGQTYESDGLDAAFAFMEEKYIPVFKKQRRNRIPHGRQRAKRRKK